MERIICIAILVLYGVVMLLMCYISIFPKEKKPFDKVLVRDTDCQNWTCGFFSHINVFNNIHKYNVGELLYKYCIPYNDDTKHLIGTTNKEPVYYQY